jgi:hypothetical protein
VRLPWQARPQVQLSLQMPPQLQLSWPTPPPFATGNPQWLYWLQQALEADSLIFPMVAVVPPWRKQTQNGDRFSAQLDS